jgi:hypothetical protein
MTMRERAIRPPLQAPTRRLVLPAAMAAALRNGNGKAKGGKKQ